MRGSQCVRFAPSKYRSGDAAESSSFVLFSVAQTRGRPDLIVPSGSGLLRRELTAVGLPSADRHGEPFPVNLARHHVFLGCAINLGNERSAGIFASQIVEGLVLSPGQFGPLLPED